MLVQKSILYPVFWNVVHKIFFIFLFQIVTFIAIECREAIELPARNAQSIIANGWQKGEMYNKLLEKVEELTLTRLIQKN